LSLSQDRDVAHDRLTRQLLVLGAIAGPLYVILGLFQMSFREGFDIRRHPLSLLSNGEWGWVQIANFVVTGSLLIAGAVGVKRAIPTGRGRTWAPLMLGLYGIGLIGAGVFSADPALGFPPGTPLAPNPVSSHGVLHFVFGAVGFAGLIASCFIFARRFNDLGARSWSMFSLATGVLFLAAFLGIASGAQGLVVPFALVVVLSFAWLALLLTKTGNE
jgi:uncharacterized membrane protein YhaH (DUF805 family)